MEQMKLEEYRNPDTYIYVSELIRDYPNWIDDDELFTRLDTWYMGADVEPSVDWEGVFPVLDAYYNLLDIVPTKETCKFLRIFEGGKMPLGIKLLDCQYENVGTVDNAGLIVLPYLFQYGVPFPKMSIAWEIDKQIDCSKRLKVADIIEQWDKVYDIYKRLSDDCEYHNRNVDWQGYMPVMSYYWAIIDILPVDETKEYLKHFDINYLPLDAYLYDINRTKVDNVKDAFLIRITI